MGCSAGTNIKNDNIYTKRNSKIKDENIVILNIEKIGSLSNRKIKLPKINETPIIKQIIKKIEPQLDPNNVLFTYTSFEFKTELVHKLLNIIRDFNSKEQEIYIKAQLNDFLYLKYNYKRGIILNNKLILNLNQLKYSYMLSSGKELKENFYSLIDELNFNILNSEKENSILTKSFYNFKTFKDSKDNNFLLHSLERNNFRAFKHVTTNVNDSGLSLIEKKIEFTIGCLIDFDLRLFNLSASKEVSLNIKDEIYIVIIFDYLATEAIKKIISLKKLNVKIIPILNSFINDYDEKDIMFNKEFIENALLSDIEIFIFINSEFMKNIIISSFALDTIISSKLFLFQGSKLKFVFEGIEKLSHTFFEEVEELLTSYSDSFKIDSKKVYGPDLEATNFQLASHFKLLDSELFFNTLKEKSLFEMEINFQTINVKSQCLEVCDDQILKTSLNEWSSLNNFKISEEIHRKDFIRESTSFKDLDIKKNSNLKLIDRNKELMNVYLKISKEDKENVYYFLLNLVIKIFKINVKNSISQNFKELEKIVSNRFSKLYLVVDIIGQEYIKDISAGIKKISNDLDTEKDKLLFIKETTINKEKIENVIMQFSLSDKDDFNKAYKTLSTQCYTNPLLSKYKISFQIIPINYKLNNFIKLIDSDNSLINFKEINTKTLVIYVNSLDARDDIDYNNLSTLIEYLSQQNEIDFLIILLGYNSMDLSSFLIKVKSNMQNSYNKDLISNKCYFKSIIDTEDYASIGFYKESFNIIFAILEDKYYTLFEEITSLKLEYIINEIVKEQPSNSKSLPPILDKRRNTVYNNNNLLSNLFTSLKSKIINDNEFNFIKKLIQNFQNEQEKDNFNIKINFKTNLEIIEVDFETKSNYDVHLYINLSSDNNELKTLYNKLKNKDIYAKINIVNKLEKEVEINSKCNICSNFIFEEKKEFYLFYFCSQEDCSTYFCLPCGSQKNSKEIYEFDKNLEFEFDNNLDFDDFFIDNNGDLIKQKISKGTEENYKHMHDQKFNLLFCKLNYSGIKKVEYYIEQKNYWLNKQLSAFKCSTCDDYIYLSYGKELAYSLLTNPCVDNDIVICEDCFKAVIEVLDKKQSKERILSTRSSRRKKKIEKIEKIESFNILDSLVNNEFCLMKIEK